MQSEDLNNVNDSSVTDNVPAAMTFKEPTEFLNATKLTNVAATDYQSSPPLDFKQEAVDFENEIDKMIIESGSSSDTEDDIKPLKPTPEIIKSLHEQNPNESIRTWLHRITQMQNQIQKKLHVVAPANDMKPPPPPQPPPTPQPSRVVKYQDLPYMGEMTLENSKPRRGRKPKKADICHLIYKNYGTIFPGTPNVKSIMDKDNKKQDKLADAVDNANRSDVQNRIISSLLEKRLTQESKRNKASNAASSSSSSKSQHQHEPLNLCIRDMDHLKLAVKNEPQSDDDIEIISEPSNLDSNSPPVLPPDAIKLPENGATNPAGYVYWPNAGVFIHPIALQQQLFYYQKMAANNNNITPPIEAATQELRKLVPKQSKSKKSDAADEDTIHETKSKRNASGGDKTPAKRKRSAIFIPPIPAENQNNPATEVSICKFKFTGGAKPSLQEKKMLSVDSGGNFRYYSGTGDKSMRGYEFFPRETLQQQVHNAQGSSTGAFLQASGEKIYPNSPVDFTAQNEFMLTPEIQNAAATASSTTTVSPDSTKNRKRKSRKSIQREKLEQTFKEKGFLIQTQQLESAEGATYCKFRQLRKFTRYLFRSWKDYLPGNVAEGVDGDKPPDLEEITEHDIENMSNLSSPGIEEDATPPP